MITATTDSGFHSFDAKKKSSVFSLGAVLIFLIAILLGVISGYGISMTTHKTVSLNSTTQSGTTSGTSIKVGDVVGSNDTSAFKDTAEGTLQNGGIGDEGQYHLVRPGGDSQDVYLTSSSVDLSQFINHKVKVWGATQAAKKAGWLMDVGRVEVLQ